MTFRVYVTQRAKDDITRNATWWADHHSVDQAVAWALAIERQVQSLSEMPERYPVAPESGRFPYDLRQQPVGMGKKKTYRALFTIIDDEVQVLTVRAAEQNDLRASDL